MYAGPTSEWLFTNEPQSYWTKHSKLVRAKPTGSDHHVRLSLATQAIVALLSIFHRDTWTHLAGLHVSLCIPDQSSRDTVTAATGDCCPETLYIVSGGVGNLLCYYYCRADALSSSCFEMDYSVLSKYNYNFLFESFIKMPNFYCNVWFTEGIRRIHLNETLQTFILSIWFTIGAFSETTTPRRLANIVLAEIHYHVNHCICNICFKSLYVFSKHIL